MSDSYLIKWLLVISSRQASFPVPDSGVLVTQSNIPQNPISDNGNEYLA
jgi:hypothetical protein